MKMKVKTEPDRNFQTQISIRMLRCGYIYSSMKNLGLGLTKKRSIYIVISVKIKVHICNSIRYKCIVDVNLFWTDILN